MNDNEVRLYIEWLKNRLRDETSNLFSTIANDKTPIETIKRKFGHVEGLKVSLEAISVLCDSGSAKFIEEYLPGIETANKGDI